MEIVSRREVLEELKKTGGGCCETFEAMSESRRRERKRSEF